MSNFLKIYGFFLGAAVAIAAAFTLPTPTGELGDLYFAILSRGSVMTIFFIQGLSLSFDNLKAGTLKWRLHLLVQSYIYILFPLVGLIALMLLGSFLHPDLYRGFVYLCALPTPVATSVAITVIARGNVPAAMFNAALASLVGILITPAIMRAEVDTHAQVAAISFPIIALELFSWMIVPLLVGHFIRPLVHDWSVRHRPYIKRVDRFALWVLIYVAFCESIAMGTWENVGPAPLAMAVPGVIILFTLMFVGLQQLGRLIQLNEEDGIAALFCGSQKSIASGLAMAQILFGSDPGVGLILLPLLLYYPLQMFVCSVRANQWGIRRENAELSFEAID